MPGIKVNINNGPEVSENVPHLVEETSSEPHIHIHRLSCIELDVNPKNASFQLIEEKDQMKLKCTLLLKMQWNSLKAKPDNELEKDPENNDIEKFGETHYPGVPQISGINGNTDDGIDFDKDNDVKIKKVLLTNRLVGKDAEAGKTFEEMTNLLNDLTKSYGGKFEVEQKIDKATGTKKATKVKGYIINKRGKAKDGSDDELAYIDVGRYQMTQLIKFQVPLASMTSSTSADFPYDAYDIKLTFNMKPIQLLQFSATEDESKIRAYESHGGLAAVDHVVEDESVSCTYQLLFDFLKNSQKYKALNKPSLPNMTYKKENFYLLVTVKEWPKIASCICKQEFLDFDIEPFSLTMESPQYIKSFRRIRSEKYYETAFFITFSMVRSVFEPAVAVMVPLWIFMVMQPFVYFFQLDVLDSAYTYLVTLLIAVMGQRATIQVYQKHTSGITWADMEFFFVIFITGLQMAILKALYATILDNKLWTFVAHAIIVACIILYDLYKIYSQYRLLVYNIGGGWDDPRLIRKQEVTKLKSLREYRSLVRLQRALHQTVYAIMDKQTKQLFQFDRKTYLSLNLKWLCRHELPDDLFRWRGTGSTFIAKDTKMQPFYTRSNSKGFKKDVYSISIKNSDLLFEVQYLPKDFVMNPEYVRMYREHKYGSLWQLNPKRNDIEASAPPEYNKAVGAPRVTPWQLRWLLFLSVCFEIWNWEWRHVANDYSLYCMAMAIAKTEGGVERPASYGYFYNGGGKK